MAILDPLSASGSPLSDDDGPAPPWQRVEVVDPPEPSPQATPLATVTPLAGRVRSSRSRPVASDRSAEEPALADLTGATGNTVAPWQRTTQAVPSRRPADAVVATGRNLPARPPIRPEPSILGLSRRTRGDFGSKVFTWFFIAIFALILVQMLVSLWSFS